MMNVNAAPPRKLTKARPPAKDKLLVKDEISSEKTAGSNTIGGPRKLTKRSVSVESGKAAREDLNTNDPENNNSIFGIFQYASHSDSLLQIIGCLASITAGTLMPLITVVLGSSIRDVVTASDPSQLTSSINQRVCQLLALSGAAIAAAYAQSVCFLLAGERICRRLRSALFATLLAHDVAALEALGAGAATANIASHVTAVEDALAQKAGLCLSSASCVLAAFGIAFGRNPQLAATVCAAVPLVTLPATLMSGRIARCVNRAAEEAAAAQRLALEAVSNVATVRSLGVQDIMADVYDDLFRGAERLLCRKSFWLASIIGWTYLVLFSAYALAFWEGSRLLVSGNLDIGVVVNVLFSVVIGMLALGRVAKYLQAFTTAVSVAKRILGVIGRRRRGVLSGDPKRWDLINGDIMFKSVSFSYPNRPEVLVLDGLNLHLPAGKTTAIVGASGCGKSTIVGLLEGFYGPTSGSIRIDGQPMEKLNISAIRSQISLVSQEPALFSMSIYENVRLGIIGTPFENARPWIQRQMVVEACRTAGISDVIDALPRKYDTPIGPKGTLLSGGQRQRLAFARAIIRSPKILILDEPTSALDRESENIIQEALEMISVGRTVIVIAHRLNTIKNADSIVVIDRGKVVEQGTHYELLQHKGAYFSLLQAQASSVELASKYASSNYEAETEKSHLEQPSRSSSSTADFMKQNLDIPKASESKQGIIKHLLQIQKFNSPEKHLMVLGFLGAIASGAVYPVQAFLFAKLVVLSATPQDPTFLSRATAFSLAFFIVAGAKCLSLFTSTYSLGVCCERMVGRVRSLVFRCILNKDIEWFQGTKAHSAENLVCRLAEACPRLAGLHSSSLATFVEIVTNLISGAVFSLIVAWQYAIVVIPVVPLIVFASYLRFLMLTVFEKAITEWHSQSAVLVCEAVASIRTVKALTREKQLLIMYRSALDKAGNLAAVSILKSSVMLAVASGMTYLVNAFAIWYGTRLLAQGRIDFFQYSAVYFALTFGAQDAGELAGHVPDFALGKAAADELWELRRCDDVAGAQNSQHRNDALLQETNCPISLDNVSFAYRARPQEVVLSDINISIQPGQHVALVGASGSGKSTLLGLLARYYTPLVGSIKISGQDINTITPAAYHSLVSIVPQEPVLFPGTIRFNLLFKATTISQEWLEEACHQANILDFIQSLPQGFETQCSNVEMSVGQKQRIVIARALVRNPKILLLDEPTASLDSLSTKHVLAALESASQERTTITVAHNLESIMGVDVVHVVDQGRIVESGPPLELLHLKGGKFADIALRGVETS